MEKTNEIGPFNKSPEASIKRFEARQKHQESTEGKVISAAREAKHHIERDIERDIYVKEKEDRETPDVVKKKNFWGFPLGTVEKWIKKPKNPNNQQ